MLPIILLVEDDDTLRMLTSDALTLLDAQVLECSGADEALTILESGILVNLLFTDIRMPGRLDGLELANLVSMRWPLLPIIVTSGNRLSTDILPSGAAFIPKPWTLGVLFETVRPLLGSG
ncbi:response regulator [Pseudomonas sp. JUb42]|uniref:response regulator n=1 Tax=Pseudomonas sp. JUb42 TaxID=2940611 RepID=UPI002168F0D3|nr:response regulator [Pseudomonas sp. JUb42]